MQSAEAITSDRSAPTGDPDGFRLRIGGGPRAAGRARSELSRMSDDLDGPVLDTLRLLVTELVTNAVRHAGATSVELFVALGRERVRVEIANPGVSFRPLVRPAGPETESGWGLFLVDRLSDDWGVDAHAAHQRIWFEIARR